MKNKIKAIIAAFLLNSCTTTNNKIQDPYARIPWNIPAEEIAHD